MNNSGITINDTAVIIALRQFAPDKMAEANRRALAASSMVLVRAARLKLRGVTANAQSTRTADRRGWSRLKGSKRLGSLEDGIRFRTSQTGTMSRINILGDFRLKFFEGGTALRSKRSGANTGMMTARPFFHPAFYASQEQMYNALANSLNKSVEKK